MSMQGDESLREHSELIERTAPLHLPGGFSACVPTFGRLRARELRPHA
jgi:hypothetical protein